MAPQAPTLMDPDTAFSVVQERVHNPVFFEKLARDWNIQPRTNEEAMEMLTMAAQLRMAHAHQEKQAAAVRSPLADARSHLNAQMQRIGLGGEVAQMHQRQVKQAAVQGSFDPELANAILCLQAAADENAVKLLTGNAA